MQIVLLSGGSGERLWPLSNSIRSKQFLDVLKDENGNRESMVQRIFRQIKDTDSNISVTIATSKSQVPIIHQQLGQDVSISVEPCRKDTFPAIVLAVSYLLDKKGISEEEPIVVCPVDPYVDNSYFKAIKNLAVLVEESQTKLALMGIEPTYPSEKYGYIIPQTATDQVTSVETFKEKPSKKVAEEYLRRGALWNGGIFAFKAKYLLKKAHKLIKFVDYSDLYSKYDSLDKISFDYAVVEEEQDIKVMRYSGSWKDLGTWNTLTDAISEESIGNVRMDDSSQGVNVINELDIPILVMGIKDAVITASPEGILVSNKEASANIKPFVETIHQQIMFAQKSWGSFRVLDVTKQSLTLKLSVPSGRHMNYHSHQFRDEIWNIISGVGIVVVDNTEKLVKAGDSVKLPRGSKHTIIAIKPLTVIEIQNGNDIRVNDKVKSAFDFDSLIEVD